MKSYIKFLSCTKFYTAIPAVGAKSSVCPASNYMARWKRNRGYNAPAGTFYGTRGAVCAWWEENEGS